MKFPEEKEHLMEALFNYASMSIIVVDSSGNIVLVNPFALKKFGYLEEELVGRKVEQLIPGKFHEKHIIHRKGFIQHPIDRPMGVGMDLYAVKKNGAEFPVEVSLGYYTNNGQKFVLAFLSDITIRKKDEEEIKNLNEKLEDKVEQRTNELHKAMKTLETSKEDLVRSLQKEKDLGELKSRFVTMASHEFRTPLSTVLSSSFLLEKYTKTEEQEKRKKHLDRITSSVKMLTDILNDFLSVGKIEEGRIVVRTAEFNIKDHVAGIIAEINGISKAGQKILYGHSGEEQVLLDAGLLKHIVMNLLSNAIKFSPENTAIEIESRRLKDRLWLKIKDKGIGISREDRVHLFERFYRGSNVTNIQGTGLGLHIVAKYTELMNGTIKCNSELEKGTEFILEFDTSEEHS